MIEIITAGAEDADVVAALHAASWKVSYRGIMADDYLDTHADADRQAYWQHAMATGRYPIVMLARESGVAAGFVAVHNDPDDEAYDFTVEHLHVARGAKGRGIGKALLAAAARLAQGLGGSNICLWVFEDNVAAIAFYERLGGVTDAYGSDAMVGKPDRRMVWERLCDLIDACEEGAP